VDNQKIVQAVRHNIIILQPLQPVLQFVKLVTINNRILLIKMYVAHVILPVKPVFHPLVA
jgi:hypothetical protein